MADTDYRLHFKMQVIKKIYKILIKFHWNASPLNLKQIKVTLLQLNIDINDTFNPNFCICYSRSSYVKHVSEINLDFELIHTWWHINQSVSWVHLFK